MILDIEQLLGADKYALLQQTAHRLDVPVSDLVRDAIEAHLDMPDDVIEDTPKADIVASIERIVADVDPELLLGVLTDFVDNMDDAISDTLDTDSTD